MFVSFVAFLQSEDILFLEMLGTLTSFIAQCITSSVRRLIFCYSSDDDADVRSNFSYSSRQSVREGRDNRDSRARDTRSGRDIRDGRDSRDGRESRDGHERYDPFERYDAKFHRF